MNTCSEYNRIIWLHNNFKNNSFHIDDYFHKFGVRKRTFQRDIWKMRNYLDAPLVSKDGKYFYTEATFELPALLLSERELFGLLVASSIVSKYKSTVMHASLVKILDRLAGLLSTDIKYFYLDTNRCNQRIRDFNWEFLQEIIKAIYTKKTLEITYHSFNKNKTTKRRVDPYHVYNYKGDFYMAAFCHKHKEFRDFLIGRIKKMNCLNGRYESRGFNLDKYFSDKQWGIIKGGKLTNVSFKARKHIVPWILEKYSDIVMMKRETKLWSYFEMRINVTDEFVNWVFGYGKDMVILTPDTLMRKLKKKCREVEGIYGK